MCKVYSLYRIFLHIFSFNLISIPLRQPGWAITLPLMPFTKGFHISILLSAQQERDSQSSVVGGSMQSVLSEACELPEVIFVNKTQAEHLSSGMRPSYVFCSLCQGGRKCSNRQLFHQLMFWSEAKIERSAQMNSERCSTSKKSLYCFKTLTFWCYFLLYHNISQADIGISPFFSHRETKTH